VLGILTAMERMKGPTKTLAKVAMKEQEIVVKALHRVAKEREMVAKEQKMMAEEREMVAKEKIFVPRCDLEKERKR